MTYFALKKDKIHIDERIDIPKISVGFSVY